jgi:hypothetical protein
MFHCYIGYVNGHVFVVHTYKFNKPLVSNPIHSLMSHNEEGQLHKSECIVEQIVGGTSSSCACSNESAL